MSIRTIILAIALTASLVLVACGGAQQAAVSDTSDEVTTPGGESLDPAAPADEATDEAEPAAEEPAADEPADEPADEEAADEEEADDSGDDSGDDGDDGGDWSDDDE